MTPEELAEYHAAYERPHWVKELSRFLGDTLIDYTDPDGADDEVTDRVQDAAMAVVCDHYGHFIENDMCGMPAHRYCAWCQKRFSDIPIGPYRGAPVNSDKTCG